MRHHDSDHWALVMQVETDPAGVRRYEKDRRPFTVSLLPRPLLRRDAMLAKLVEAVEKSPVKERSENVGVRLGTWSLVDRRAELRKAPWLTQRESRRLARAIRVWLNSYPVNWSVEKAKKKSKKSCKKFHGVADFGQILHASCTKSNSEKRWCQRGAPTTALKALVSSPIDWLISSYCPEARGSI